MNDILITTGGFSMGGALSLYYGLQYGKGLAGVFCLSSFLSNSSKLYQVSVVRFPNPFTLTKTDVTMNVNSTDSHPNWKSTPQISCE